MPTIEEVFSDLINLLNVKGRGSPTQILYKLSQLRAQWLADMTIKADLVAGLVPTTQLPNSVIHALEYKGGWDASGAVYPTPSGLETGWYYIITTGGIIGGTVYIIGDWIIYNGTSWDRLSYESYTSGNFATDFGLKDTDDLTEGAKKFWADSLFNTAFGLKDTDDLAEGAKKFWSQTLFDAAFGTAFGLKDIGDLATKAHASLTDILPNQHHTPTAGGDLNLADLAEKNHASLSNVLTSQHHVKTVAGELNLADLLEKAHSSLSGVTSDLHHNKQHSIVSAPDHTIGNDKIIYSTGAGVITELTLGTSGKYLKSQGTGSAPAWDTPTADSGIGIESADNIIHSNDADKSTALDEMVILKRIVIHKNLKNFRVRWGLYMETMGTAYTWLYKNGVFIDGSNNTTESDTEVTVYHVCENFNVGDILEIWGRAVEGGICHVLNMKIIYNEFVNNDP